MPLATPHQYATMLDPAADGRYAYAAVNVTSSETLNAALRGFELANADGIVQISVGAPGTCPDRQYETTESGGRRADRIDGEVTLYRPDPCERLPLAYDPRHLAAMSPRSAGI